MKQITTKQVVQQSPIQIDPGESAPRDFIGWEFLEGPDGATPILDEYDDPDDVAASDDAVATDDVTVPASDTAEDSNLGAPTNILVTSQVVRFNASGQHVVDVTLTFDNVVGAIKYESRVAK